eukprot:c9459_g1_i1.p1 GENE.c9459_g1_i1~~c9459_g1_i1.p1  ORF type:complete len:247 (-),score=86.76 c9459_g1_i1:73-792(-)
METGFMRFFYLALVPFSLTFFFYWTVGGIFAALDYYFDSHGLLSKYKIQSNKVIDWRHYESSAKYVMSHFFLVILPFTCVFGLLFDWRGCADFSDPIPSIGTCVLHLMGFVFVEEIGFYYTHRLSHHPLFYAAVHKRHHEWKSPVAITAIYAHPLEQIFTNLTPIVAGGFIFKSHIILVTIFLVIAVLNTLIAHCGYNFPYLDAKKHDLHHSKTDVNYGFLGLCDWMHKTRAKDKYKNI